MKKKKRITLKKSSFRNDRKGLYFGDVSLLELASLLDKTGIEGTQLNKIKTQCCAAMCIALWLVQLRLDSKLSSPQEVEQIPSFKRIKKSCVVDASSPIVYTASVAAALLSLVHTEYSDEQEIQEYIESLVESYSPNSKYFEKCTQQNYTLWASGFMSRHVGIFSSCPATNMKIFNLPSTCDSWSCDDLVNNIGPLGTNVKVEDVLEVVHKIFFVDGGGFPVSSLTFDEPPLTSNVENQMLRQFPNSAILRTLAPSMSKKVKQESLKDVEKYLTKIELLKFEQANKLGLKSVVDKLLNKVQEKKVAEASNNEVESSTQSSATQATSSSEAGAQAPAEQKKISRRSRTSSKS